ncbi:MAG: insulinase family protein [Actinobacteria bacterium]|nr:insulinase family protein [Actinomycetota bacterium]
MFYRETVLDNGITVLTEEMGGVRSVTLGLWFCVGSRDEKPEQAGMSHFMEHMMFKGTKTRDAIQISSEFEQLGAELNAFTSKEYTCYYARFVDDKLPRAIDILSDMVIDSVFAQDCIDFEREVVIEEIARSEDTPDDHVYDLFTDKVFPTHPLGRPIIGTRDIVGGFKHEDCVSFHNTHYSTGNLVIVAAGNVDHDAFVALCEEHFATLPKGPRTVRDEFSDLDNEPFCFLKKETEQAHILYGMPSLPANHPDRFASILLDCALGGGMSSRLFQEVREKRGLAYAIYASTSYYIGIGEFAVYAGTRPTNIDEVVGIIKTEIDKVLKDGITEDELARVRDFTVGQLVLGMEATRNRMLRLGKNAIMGNDQLSLEETIESYNAVTLEDIARVAQVYAAQPTLAIISPYDDKKLKKMLTVESEA